MSEPDAKLAAAEAVIERYEATLKSLMFAAQGTAEFDWVMNKCAAALTATNRAKETEE